MNLRNTLLHAVVVGFIFVMSGAQAIEYYEIKRSEKVKIAFLADVHLHDIFAHIEKADPDEIARDLQTNQPLLVRSLYAQLNSTRLFNENYFAFLQVLNELADKNITLVALPGDFTDDGQPINIRALASILRHYETHYGMRFFAVPGNHDPVKPFTVASGKKDFLSANGKEFGVFSYQHPNCIEHRAICDDGLKNWGYSDILLALNEFGFSKKKTDLLYEVPYKNREYISCDPANEQRCIMIPDASYLVEPVKGVWLLAIDANVYLANWQQHPITFQGSSNAGYNALINEKPQLITWLKHVVKRAKQQNKALVAFSHFPMADFYDNANKELNAIFPNNAFSLRRVPTAQTAKILADTGLTLHFAGHMHLNDTALITGSGKTQLVNVQIPSLAAYKAAYKVAELDLDKHTAYISTHTLNEVTDFDRLFDLYKKEWKYRHDQGLNNFDPQILEAKNYDEFTQQHLFALIEQRFLKRDWPNVLTHWLFQNKQLANWLENMKCLDNADTRLKKYITAYTTKNWLRDFYLLRNGDVTADVSEKQRVFNLALAQYIETGPCKKETEIQQYLALMIHVMAKFSTHELAKDFTLDLTTGKVQ